MKKKTFRRIVGEMGPFRLPYLTGLIGMGLLVFLFQTQIALVFQDLFDALTTGTYADVLDSIIIGILVVMGIFMIIPIFIYLAQKAIVNITGGIRKKAFAKLTLLPSRYFMENHSGEITSRLTNDISEMEKTYSDLLFGFMVNVIAGIGTTIVMFFLDWRLSLVGVGAAIITVLVNTVYAKRIRVISTDVQSSLGTLNTKLINIISGLRVVRIFNIHRLILEKFNVSNDRVLSHSINRVNKQSLINGVNAFLGFMSFVGITTVGAYLVLIGETTVGTIVAVTQLQNGIRELARMLGDFITNLQASLAAGDRVFELLDEPEEPLYYKQNGASKASELAFDQVTFGYDEAPVLKALSFTLDKGRSAALVGPSGSGKSTVFKLLLQFHPPQKGTLSIEGNTAAHSTLKQLREKIAYVPQDAYLFNGTIKDNILYGNPSASEASLLNASKIANAHDFIKTLSEGYETLVGEHGHSLSGGQRQRIAIARAMIKDAPIILFDEATSALDNVSEAKIQAAMKKIMKEKTVLIIAHRLSTTVDVDTIYVIDRGEIVEQGSHQTLLEQNGLYTMLYEKQMIDAHKV